jgi:hypothetical protein
MTEQAINFGMFSAQGEPGLTVVKAGSRFKCFEIMTGGAVG